MIIRIYNYATASTDTAAYILGGGQYGYHFDTIAQFQNNEWLKVGNLKEKKYFMSAISNAGEYLIIGGTRAGVRNDRRLVT